MQYFVQLIPKRVSGRHLRHVLKWGIMDAALILLCYTAAYAVRSVEAPLDYLANTWFVVVAVMMTLLSLLFHRVYHRIWTRTSGHGAKTIVQAVAIATVFILALDLLITPRPIPLSVVLMANVLVMGSLVTIRYRSRLISGISWRWGVIMREEVPESIQKQVRVLIVGAGESGQALAMRLRHRIGDNHHKIVGFVDDDDSKQSMYVEGCPVLGTRDNIPAIVDKHRIELIIVAIHNIAGQDFRDILSYCEHTRARIKVVPDTLALIDGTLKAELLRDVKPEDLIGRSPITRHESVDLTPVTGKIVLVTGAAGSIGSELSRQIASYAPVTLIILDNNESALHDLTIDLRTRHTDLIIVSALVDVTRSEAVDAIFSQYRPQVVFHAAAYKHVPLLEDFPQEGIRVNVGGTSTLAEAAKKHNVERFVLISTDKAVKPSSVMGATKRLGELLIHALSQQNQHRTLFTAVRFGNVLASRGSVVPTFNRQIENGGPVTITHPNMTRYFMSIAEAVNLVIHAACLTEGDDIFVLRMGEVVRIVDIAERMIRLRGLRPHEDIEIKYVGVRPGEKLHEELFDASESPEPTIHPHIIKLHTWTHNFQPHHFMDQVNHLLCNGVTDPRTALAALVQMQDLHYNHRASTSVPETDQQWTQ